MWWGGGCQDALECLDMQVLCMCGSRLNGTDPSVQRFFEEAQFFGWRASDQRRRCRVIEISKCHIYVRPGPKPQCGRVCRGPAKQLRNQRVVALEGDHWALQLGEIVPAVLPELIEIQVERGEVMNCVHAFGILLFLSYVPWVWSFSCDAVGPTATDEVFGVGGFAGAHTFSCLSGALSREIPANTDYFWIVLHDLSRKAGVLSLVVEV